MLKDTNVIADKLKALREEKGITRSDLAVKVGISLSAIGNYERGINIPDAYTLKLLADSLDVTTDFLLDENWTRRTSNLINIDDIGLTTNAISVLIKKREEEINTGHLMLAGLDYLVTHTDFSKFLSLVNLCISDYSRVILNNLKNVYENSTTADEKENIKQLIDQTTRFGDLDFSKKAAKLLEKMLDDAKNI